MILNYGTTGLIINFTFAPIFINWLWRKAKSKSSPSPSSPKVKMTARKTKSKNTPISSKCSKTTPPVSNGSGKVSSSSPSSEKTFTSNVNARPQKATKSNPVTADQRLMRILISSTATYHTIAGSDA